MLVGEAEFRCTQHTKKEERNSQVRMGAAPRLMEEAMEGWGHGWVPWAAIVKGR
jgi:hypothetical protein